MPSAVATAGLIAAAARALHEAGHPAVAEALSLFLAGAGFEDALGVNLQRVSINLSIAVIS
jgi:hypothetical protein